MKITIITDELKRSRIFWYIIVFIWPVSCVLSLLLVEFIVRNPLAIEEQKNLESELALLRPPIEARLIESGASRKTSQASAFERYYLDWTADQIFEYYEAPLEQNGWRFAEQVNITYGAVGRRYCKGDYTADLDYYESGYTWKYSIWLSWGLTSECLIRRGGMSDYWFWIGFPLSLVMSVMSLLALALMSRRFTRGT